MTSSARKTRVIGLAGGAALLTMAACVPVPFLAERSGHGDAAKAGAPRAATEARRAVAEEGGAVPVLSEAAAPRRSPPLPRRKPGTTGGREAPAVTAQRFLTVVRGDTLSAIARRHGLPMDEIVALNRLTPPYRLLAGQRILLPQARVHAALRGEPSHVPDRGGAESRAPARENRAAAYNVERGARLDAPAPPARALPVPPVRWSGPAVVQPPRSGARLGHGFLWPVEGPLISRFGSKPGGMHNDGINIAAPIGSKVRAARHGVVAYAGNELRGYGNLVLIRHDDGWMTAYAHNDSLLVEKGEVVRRGQVISRSGKSGRVSRPQAHFEIRRNGEPRDPLRLLSRE